MRLSGESVREGRHLTPEERIALQAEEIKQLQQENDELKVQNAAMREALEYIRNLLPEFGPMDGRVWITIDKAMNYPDAVTDYHNPADVEALKKVREALENAQTAYLNEREMREYEYEVVREALAEIDKALGGETDERD